MLSKSNSVYNSAFHCLIGFSCRHRSWRATHRLCISSGLVVSPPLSGCPNPCRYPTTCLWLPPWPFTHVMESLQVTTELKVEAFRYLLADLVQLHHHLVHEIDARPHLRKSAIFLHLGIHLGPILSSPITLTWVLTGLTPACAFGGRTGP